MTPEDKDATMGLLLAAHNRANEALIDAEASSFQAFKADSPGSEWAADDAALEAQEAKELILEAISFVEIS